MTLPRIRPVLGLALTAVLLPGLAFAQSTPQTLETPTSVIRSGEHIRGRPRADITLVMYSDLECPFCQQTMPVMTKILRKYRNKVNLMYRHFPLEFHPNAQSAAEASECVGYLGGNLTFWSFVDSLMAARRFTALDYYPIAMRYGVDVEKLAQCIDSGAFASKVEAQRAGGVRAGVEGTPTVFIVNKAKRTQERIDGAQEMEEYTRIIDRMLDENEFDETGGFKLP